MKKGFTLIELLAVIVILAIIALIATPIILGIINDTKESATLRSADFYIDSLENEIALENMKLGGSLKPKECVIDSSGNATCDGTLLEIDVDGEKPNGGSITFENGKVTDVTLTFGDKTVSMNNKGELVLGESQANESICKLVSGESNTIGSKYQCKVKEDMEEGFEDGYYFYVLSHNDDGTTNLIMERNICYDGTNDVGKVATEEHKCLMPWYSNGTHLNDGYVHNSYGPIRAMVVLHNATKDWDNIEDMIMDYKDEGTLESDLYGYGGIKTTGNITIITRKNEEETLKIENLKARMPKYSEVYGENKCLRGTSNNGSCPLWLVNYLKKSQYVTGENLYNISYVGGYWTLSSFPGVDYAAWTVTSDGILYGMSVVLSGDLTEMLYGGTTGVRPVITVKL